MAYLILPIGLWFVFRSLLHVGGVAFYSDNLASEVGLSLLVGFFAFLIPPILTVFALFKPIRILVQAVGNQPTTPSRDLMRLFMLEQARVMKENIDSLRQTSEPFSASEIAAWVRRCFETFRGRYIGIEAALPSRFMKMYAGYLDAHHAYLDKTGRLGSTGQDSVRVLLATESEVARDKIGGGNDYATFIQWHLDNRVPLLHMNRLDAEALRESGSPESLVVGLWEGEASIVFMPVDGDQGVRLRMALVGEPLYQACRTYVHKVLPQAHPLTETGLFPRELSQNWETYVAPRTRLLVSEEFLLNRLESLESRLGLTKRDLRVLDAGAGIGIDAITLMQRHYNVTLNEVDPGFRRLLVEYANKERVLIPKGNFPDEDWLQFPLAFPEANFHLVFVLGNSLCLLPERDDIVTTIKNFYYVLAPGGMLIVDERNFPYIADNWDKGDNIEENPWRNFRYRFHVNYCGREVRGAPYHTENGRIVFQFGLFHDDKSEEPERILAQQSFYAFKPQELETILKEARFDHVEVYSDMNIEKPEYWKEADYFTYVAWKPDSVSPESTTS